MPLSHFTDILNGLDSTRKLTPFLSVIRVGGVCVCMHLCERHWTILIRSILFKLNNLFLNEVELTYDIMLASSVQHSDLTFKYVTK